MDRCETGCGRHVLVWWARTDGRDWQLCGPCTTRLGAALTADGYDIIADDRVPVTA